MFPYGIQLPYRCDLPALATPKALQAGTPRTGMSAKPNILASRSPIYCYTLSSTKTADLPAKALAAAGGASPP